jgi:hypothetical protein
MVMRRRPLLRAAAVGGSAYMMGKNVSRRAAEQGQQQPAAQVPAQPGPSMADQLSQLSVLRDQGALTDDEFAAAKARLLGG